jgi:TRAP-type mannitol/chloroaromatic compound transport system permease small subunit
MMNYLLKFGDAVERLLKQIADAGAWAFILCILVITLDVVTRKFGFQFPGLGSTRLQELEWHLHGILMCTWLGYAYIRNAHVRIDVLVGGLSRRGKLWLEFWCCLLFAVPYLVVAVPYAQEFFLVSWLQGESSDSPVGLAYRWVIKGFLYLSFLTVSAAVLSVIARCTVALFGTTEQAAKAYTPFATIDDKRA